MRFKGVEKPSAVSAQIRDLSTSGMSFVVSTLEAPHEGEMLKVEFTLPRSPRQIGNRKISWFASVVRIENPNPWEKSVTIVASRFYRLPSGLTNQLKNCLEPKVGTSEKADFDLGAPTAKDLLLFASLLAASVSALVLMTLPVTVWLVPFRALIN
jgi:hypothetical protein